MNLIEELQWRGLIHDIMPGTEELLEKEMVSGYVGFDPTADSLHIGNLVPITLLKHLQRAGHKPLALVGGATGLIGDPSGKTAERKLLDEEAINHNLNGQKKQLEKFLDFDCGDNSAEVVNNYDWFKEFGFLEFIRDVGKHITVSYMMSKDSVKNRLEAGGLSFTEFSYQMIQGYDFYHLNKTKNVKLQMGGSDQWGNITTGTEMIRRIGKSEGFAITAPLVKKADGSKFGKSEGGNVWLDAEKTSPYKFYQYWLNTSDADAENFIKTFTFIPVEELTVLIAEHNEDPGRNILQKRLADEMTTMVHSEDALAMAKSASGILFGKSTEEALRSLDESTFLSVFEGVPQVEVSKEDLLASDAVQLFGQLTQFLKSNGEVRRALKENSLSVNKTKIKEDYQVTEEALIDNKYLILQRGKKNYFMLKVK